MLMWPFLILFFAQGTNYYSVSSTIYCLLFTNVSVLITKCPFFLFCKELIGLRAPDQIQYSFVFILFLFCFHHRYVYLKAAITHLKHIQPD